MDNTNSTKKEDDKKSSTPGLTAEQVKEKTRKAFEPPTERQKRLQAEAKAKGGLTPSGIEKFQKKAESISKSSGISISRAKAELIKEEQEKLGLDSQDVLTIAKQSLDTRDIENIRKEIEYNEQQRLISELERSRTGQGKFASEQEFRRAVAIENISKGKSQTSFATPLETVIKEEQARGVSQRDILTQTFKGVGEIEPSYETTKPKPRREGDVFRGTIADYLAETGSRADIQTLERSGSLIKPKQDETGSQFLGRLRKTVEPLRPDESLFITGIKRVDENGLQRTRQSNVFDDSIVTGFTPLQKEKVKKGVIESIVSFGASKEGEQLVKGFMDIPIQLAQDVITLGTPNNNTNYKYPLTFISELGRQAQAQPEKRQAVSNLALAAGFTILPQTLALPVITYFSTGKAIEAYREGSYRKAGQATFLASPILGKVSSKDKIVQAVMKKAQKAELNIKGELRTKSEFDIINEKSIKQFNPQRTPTTQEVVTRITKTERQVPESYIYYGKSKQGVNIEGVLTEKAQLSITDVPFAFRNFKIVTKTEGGLSKVSVIKGNKIIKEFDAVNTEKLFGFTEKQTIKKSKEEIIDADDSALDLRRNLEKQDIVKLSKSNMEISGQALTLLEQRTAAKSFKKAQKTQLSDFKYDLLNARLQAKNIEIYELPTKYKFVDTKTRPSPIKFIKEGGALEISTPAFTGIRKDIGIRSEFEIYLRRNKPKKPKVKDTKSKKFVDINDFIDSINIEPLMNIFKIDLSKPKSLETNLKIPRPKQKLKTTKLTKEKISVSDQKVDLSKFEFSNLYPEYNVPVGSLKIDSLVLGARSTKQRDTLIKPDESQIDFIDSSPILDLPLRRLSTQESDVVSFPKYSIEKGTQPESALDRIRKQVPRMRDSQIDTVTPMLRDNQILFEQVSRNQNIKIGNSLASTPTQLQSIREITKERIGNSLDQFQQTQNNFVTIPTTQSIKQSLTNEFSNKAKTVIPFNKPKLVTPKQNTGAYDVEVRRGGVFKKVNDKALDYNDALSFGSRFVDNDLAASFRTVKSKSNVTPDKSNDKYFQNNRNRYYQKNGMYIERNKFRLDSPSEINQIQRARGKMF